MVTNLDANGMICSSKIRIYSVVMLLLFILNIQQGRSQDLVEVGGAKIIFFGFGNLHVAKPCALIGGSGAFFKMVQFGGFWCIYSSDFVLNILIITIFSIFFFFSKKLPIVVIRDVCPSVCRAVCLSVCVNNFFSR